MLDAGAASPGLGATEDDDARGICRCVVLRTGLAVVAAVARDAPTFPRHGHVPQACGSLEATDSAARTPPACTPSPGGAYGPTEIGYRSNDPNATCAESGPTGVGAPLCVTTIEPVTIEGVHLNRRCRASYASTPRPALTSLVRNCYLDAYVRNGIVAWFNSSTDSPSTITFENNYVHGGTIVVGWWVAPPPSAKPISAIITSRTSTGVWRGPDRTASHPLP